MADVFVSYSRRDTEFVRRLVEALQARGKEVWLDVEGIRDGEVFPAALRSAVEGSDGFVFVITPDSVGSPYCAQEVDHALELNKRIVPVLRERVADERIPEAVQVRNWVPLDDDDEFAPGVDRLVEALDTDLDWTRGHTRWLLKALEWEAENRDRSFLLRGAELAAAEDWLASAAGKQPEPSSLHREYLLASRMAASRRLRLLVGAMSLALAISVGLGVLALTQRDTARHQSAIARQQTATARSRELAALSSAQLANDPELAILLGARAVRSQATPQAMFSLRQALDGSALRATLRGHRSYVRQVSFSPDRRLIATVSGDRTVRLWSAATHRTLRSIHLSSPPNATAFAPGGRRLFVARNSGGLAIYDLATGRERLRLQPRDHVSDVVFSRDGRVFVTAGLGFVKLWDTRSLALRRALPVRGLALRAVLSRDRRYIAAGTSSGLRVWDARTGRPTEHVPGRDTFAVAFDPRKDRIAFGGADHRVRLLDAVSGRILRTVVTITDARVLGVAFSADGSHLAAGASDGIARTWSSRSWRSTGHFHGHRCCVTDVAFNPDGSLLATTSKDHTAKLWATRGNALRVLVGPHGPVTGLAFTKDGRRVAVANAGGPTVLWSIERHARPLPLPGAAHGQALALSGDAALLAVGVPGGRVRLLDARRRTVIRTLRVGHHVTSVAFDARADALGVTSGTTVAGYSTASGRPFIERKIGDATLAIAFRPHRDAVALAAANGGTENGRIYLADLPKGHVTGVLSEPNRIRAIAFSPDGSLLVGATEADTAVKVWDVASHREIRELFGHVGRVTSAAFSPDGRLLATASVDRTVRIWDVRRGLELRAIRDPAPLTSVAFDPNGRMVASGDADGTVRIWDACSGCLDPHALLALAARRVTRALTPLERTTFLGTAQR